MRAFDPVRGDKDSRRTLQGGLHIGKEIGRALGSCGRTEKTIQRRTKDWSAPFKRAAINKCKQNVIFSTSPARPSSQFEPRHDLFVGGSFRGRAIRAQGRRSGSRLTYFCICLFFSLESKGPGRGDRGKRTRPGKQNKVIFTENFVRRRCRTIRTLLPFTAK